MSEGVKDKGRERLAQWWIWLNVQGFPVSHWGNRGISHTHVGCLDWHMGLVQYYSILPSLFGIVCFASCFHIQTHMLVCTQLLTIQANHRHHGTSLLATGKADAWSESKTEQRGKLWRENATDFSFKKAITWFLHIKTYYRSNKISFKTVKVWSSSLCNNSINRSWSICLLW